MMGGFMTINVNPKFQFLYNKDELNKYRELIFWGGRRLRQDLCPHSIFIIQGYN